MSVNLKAGLYKISLNYLKKEPYTGSMDGTRFKLVKDSTEGSEDPILRLWIWPEPFCFDKTKDEEKSSKDFGFNEEGLTEAVDYLMNLQGENK